MADTLVLVGFPLTFGAMIGAAFGSFAAAMISRVGTPRGPFAPSECACGRPLNWIENVPVLGWVRTKGVAACCDTPIPVWFLVFEVGGGLTGAATLLTLT